MEQKDLTSPSNHLLSNWHQLESRVNTALEERLVRDSHYTEKEIKKVSTLSKKLFPEGKEVDFQTCEDLRALAKLSQFELKPARSITSHRKFIGPLIVFLKRLTWPLVKIHLKESYAGQQEFNCRVVEAVSRLKNEDKQLRS